MVHPSRWDRKLGRATPIYILAFLFVVLSIFWIHIGATGEAMSLIYMKVKSSIPTTNTFKKYFYLIKFENLVPNRIIFICVTYDVLMSVKILEPQTKNACVPVVVAV